MIRFAICDDNEIQVGITHTVLEGLLATRGEQAEIVDFASGQELVSHVRRNGFFDIYILDMIMPGMNGLELATTLRMLNDEGKIVFLTSSLEYAVQSYDVQASHYLLKPIDSAKFTRVIAGIMDQVATRNADVIQVKTSTGVLPLRMHSIASVTAENRMPIYRLTDGRIVTGIVMRRKFREEMATLLALPNFVECGVSRVVNLSCVETMDSESVLMNDGSVFYPPRSAMNTLTCQWLAYRNRA